MRLTWPHFDAQIFPNQSEQSGGEVDLAVSVERHVHADQLLVGQSVGAFVAEAERRIHIFQHVEHFRVMNLSPKQRPSHISSSTHNNQYAVVHITPYAISTYMSYT